MWFLPHKQTSGVFICWFLSIECLLWAWQCARLKGCNTRQTNRAPDFDSLWNLVWFSLNGLWFACIPFKLVQSKARSQTWSKLFCLINWVSHHSQDKLASSLGDLGIEVAPYVHLPTNKLTHIMSRVHTNWIWGIASHSQWH